MSVILKRHRGHCFRKSFGILGSAEFVEKVRGTHQTTDALPGCRLPLAALVAEVCAATGCHPTALQQGSRRGRAARAREGLTYLALEVCGYTGSAVADLLGVRPSAVYRAAQRGRTARGRWERVLTVGETEKNIRMSPLTSSLSDPTDSCCRRAKSSMAHQPRCRCR